MDHCSSRVVLGYHRALSGTKANLTLITLCVFVGAFVALIPVGIIVTETATDMQRFTKIHGQRGLANEALFLNDQGLSICCGLLQAEQANIM